MTTQQNSTAQEFVEQDKYLDLTPKAQENTKHKTDSINDSHSEKPETSGLADEPSPSANNVCKNCIHANCMCQTARALYDALKLIVIFLFAGLLTKWLFFV